MRQPPDVRSPANSATATSSSKFTSLTSGGSAVAPEAVHFCCHSSADAATNSPAVGEPPSPLASSRRFPSSFTSPPPSLPSPPAESPALTASPPSSPPLHAASSVPAATRTTTHRPNRAMFPPELDDHLRPKVPLSG